MAPFIDEKINRGQTLISFPVWFDEEKVEAALETAGVSLDEFFGNSAGGAGGGWKVKSWN